ncbi:hypothetical protein [Rhodococcus qingshengii]|uniref:hypothetical protein n=1 Tax=Rhodococcus qingshengii TaxID=334542 RepID=UPI001BE87A5C|nr:hypothetical protein [Rhodococcus qingshengii]MBT2276279.1 hypothetical protein [Rhodococcus qingshengii]
MAATMLVLVGFGAISAAVSTGSITGAEEGGGPGFGGTDPLSIVLTGANFAVLLLGVLGCLAGAREYGSGLITSTVAAVPRRWQVVVAKVAALAAVVLPSALIGVFLAFGAGMATLSMGGGPTISLGDEDVLRSLTGMAFYLTSLAVIGLGLGVLLRSTAGSIGALVAGILILPTIAAGLLPDSWDIVLQYLPSSAAAGFTAVMSTGTEVLGPAAGVLVLVGWVTIVLGVATTMIIRRDV